MPLTDLSDPLILVVDDDESKRYTISHALKKAGYTVAEAVTGAAALQIAEENRPALMVLDINLPDLNGFEVCRHIRQNPATADITVLQLSASFIKPEDRVLGLEEGADAYLTQPVENRELIATIRALLRMRAAENKVRNHAREWQVTFDTITDGICLLNMNRHIVRCNRAFHALAKKEPLHECSGAWHETMPDLDAEILFSRMEKSLAAEESETRFPDGRWFRMVMQPILQGERALAGAVLIISDITQRKAMDRQVMESQKALESLYEIGKTLASTLDLRTLIQVMTDEATRLTGAKYGAFFYNAQHEDVKSYDLYVLSGASHDDFKNFPMPRLTGLFGPTFRGEDTICITDVTKDGRYGHNSPHRGMPKGHLPVRSYLATPVVSREGDVIGGLFFGHPEPGVFTDREKKLLEGITAQASIGIDNARLYERISQSEEQFRTLANSIPQLAWMTDETGWIFWYNQRWFDYTGTTLEETKGWNWQKMQDPAHVDRVVESFKASITSGKAWEDTFPIRRKDGEYRWFLSRAFPIRDSMGKIVRWFGTNTDITDRREIEESLRHAKERAEEASLAKSEFLANMSHEIRTPMNAIVGIADILSRSEHLPVRQKELVATLQSGALHLMELINDVLDFAKLEQKSVQLEQIDFDPRELVENTLSLVRIKAAEKKLDVTAFYETPLPPRLKGDRLRIQQILTNLLGNAVKFTEKGGVMLTVAARPDERGGTLLSLSVADTGIGIPPEKIGSIFEKFTQANASMSREYGGTGLGLSISKYLVELMGGTITVESTPGQGSAFTVTLNLARAAAAGQRTAAPARREDAEKSRERQSKRILLVEDHKPNILVATSFLDELGYSYSTALNGFEALEKFSENAFGLVLMDIQMPEMDGLQTTRRIRALEKEKNLPPVPIIAITGHASAQDRQKCEEAGMNDYMAKPYRMSELKEKIERHM